MSKLFGAPKAPVIPDLPPPVPIVDEAAVKRTKAQTALRLRKSGGRESTILGSADKLGS